MKDNCQEYSAFLQWGYLNRIQWVKRVLMVAHWIFILLNSSANEMYFQLLFRTNCWIRGYSCMRHLYGQPLPSKRPDTCWEDSRLETASMKMKMELPKQSKSECNNVTEKWKNIKFFYFVSVACLRTNCLDPLLYFLLTVLNDIMAPNFLD